MANFAKVLTLLHTDIDWQELAAVTQPGVPASEEDILLLKLFVVQTAFHLTDEELLFLAEDRLPFRKLLDFSPRLTEPVELPDLATVVESNERLQQAGVSEALFLAVAQQLHRRGKLIRTQFLNTPRLLPDYKASEHDDDDEEDWDEDTDDEMEEDDDPETDD